jgi:signal transduction histidine kinase
MAVKASERLTRLLSDILDLSKIEAEKIEIRREEFQISEVMQSIEDIFSQASRDNGNVLQVSFDPLIPDRLSGDKTRLMQILFNLVGNASKYTRQGMVEVEATVLPSWSPGECRLLFAVQDSGMGISDHLLEQVFEPFAQGSESDSPYSRQYEGAGLGLPLVKRLVRLMHGSLSIDSRKGEGTTVYVSLPFDLPEGDEQRLEHKFP